MKVRNKGFTITELVIVIAVIAILAAVLIPTFSNVIEKANQTAASSSCNVALSEYIAMVTLDGDPDNNDVTGVVFSSNNYYYVYDGEKLNYIGNSEKDNAKLLAVTSFDTDITSLTGFTKQSVEEGTAVYEGKMKFTIGEQSVEVDLSDTTRTLYLYNVDIDGTTYAGFFTINNTYGGSGNVIQTVNYSYQSGISQNEVAVGQVEVSEEVELVLEGISAQYLSNVPIYTGDNKTITPEEVKVTASYVGGIEQVLSSNLYTLENATVNTESAVQHTVTVVYSENTSITTTFSVDVVKAQEKTIYYYNDLGWEKPHAYVWREEYINVKPAVGDFVLMGNILSTENDWELDSSIKMFKGTNAEGDTEYVVKGLRIEQGEQFKIAQVLSNESVNYFNLNSSPNVDGKDYIEVEQGVTYSLTSDLNVVLQEEALYDLYFSTANYKLYIAKSADQTTENQPNVAINSTYPDEWPGVKMTAVEGNPGLWKVDVDARAEFIVFNDGVENNSQIGINKTADIEIISDTENIYYDDGWHSDYTMYYFYNAYGWNEVYANASVTQSAEGVSTLVATDFGIRMTAVEGKPGWFAVPVASEMKTIVFSDGTDANKTDELTIDAQNQTDVYYNPNNATAGGNGWSSSFTSTTTYYFYNVRGWESVYADFGVDGGNATPWPGTLMTNNGDGWWSVEIDGNIVNNANNFVIFNDGQVDPDVGVGQTNKLKLGSYQYCTFDNWKESKDCLTTYYFYNVNDWTNVYAYAWTDPTVERETVTEYFGKFPGTEMKDIGDGWWSIAVDSSAVNIIFSDGSNNDANKTGNLTLNSETPYYNDGWMATMHTHTYSGDCDATCNECGATRETTAKHTYDNACDTDCNVCGEVRETTHNYETKHDETNHWTKCSECGATTEKVAHAWDEGTVTTEPTCTTAGVKTFTCECGATKIEEIPMLPHNPDLEWTSDGTSHWHTCGTCQQQLDKAEHVFDQKIETEDYLATAATCTAKATYYYSCVCGAKGTETFESGGMLAHQYVVKHDETQHWKECSGCGYIDETSRVEHSYTDGKCECGADEPAEPVVLESIKAEFTTEGILFVNTELTANDFEVIKVMSNSEEQPVTDTENISVALKDGSTNATEGQAIYVITYGGKSTEVTVKFTKKLTGITAVATETTVEHGETPVLTVTASYDGAEDQEVTGFKIDFNSANDGLQTVIVTYIENNITVTTTVNVVVNPTGYRTYYFYNYAGWTDVRAHAWSEEIKGEQPAIGEKVLICKTPDGIEYSFKLTLINNEYVIQGLYLPEETSVKVGKLEDDGDYFYYTLKQINEVTSTGKDTTELKLKETGVHDFYFSEIYENDKLWINKVEGNNSELPYFKKVVEFTTWPCAEMEDMGDGWWYVSIDAKAENIIFNGAIGDTRYQTDNLTLNPVTPYYCINGWKDTPDISDIIVFDLTEADNWITTSPRFAVYLFNGASSDADNNGMWLDMTAIAGNSVNYYYAVDISGLDYSKFTVCRMNPESTENNWDNKWNQTVDLQLENGLCVKIKGWSTIEQSSFAKGSATREV